MILSFPRRNDRRARSDVLARSPRGERRGIQIGPRIRIGGTAGKIGQNVKNAVTKAATDTGHFVGKVADNPLVQDATMAALMATGVGAPAAAAIMAAAKGGGALLKPGGNIGSGIRNAAKGAAQGYSVAKIGNVARGAIGALKNGAGIATEASNVGNNVGTTVGPVGDTATNVGPNQGGSWVDNIKSVLGKASSLGGDALGMAEKALGLGGGAGGAGGGGGGGRSLLDDALMVGGVAQSAAARKRAQELQDQAINYTKDAYSARQPIRQLGLARLQTQQTPDLSFLDNPANPYTRKATPFNPSAKAPVLPSGGTY